MSVWISPAASSAVRPPRSVQARASVGPIVKNVIRPSDAFRPAGDLLERRRAVAKRGRLVLGQLAELGLELEVDAAGAVLDDDHRLRRQRLERVRHLALVVGDRPAAFDVGEQRLEARDLLPELRVARLRLLTRPLEPLLDVIAVGDEQFELQCLQIGVGLGAGREPVQHAEKRVDLSQVPEQRRARTGHVLDADRRRASASPICSTGASCGRAGRRRSAPSRRAASHRARARPRA